MPSRMLPIEVKFCLIRLPFLRLCDAATPDLVQKVDDDIVLLDPETVKMLPYRVCELVLGLSS